MTVMAKPTMPRLTSALRDLPHAPPDDEDGGACLQNLRDQDAAEIAEDMTVGKPDCIDGKPENTQAGKSVGKLAEAPPDNEDAQRPLSARGQSDWVHGAERTIGRPRNFVGLGPYPLTEGQRNREADRNDNRNHALAEFEEGEEQRNRGNVNPAPGAESERQDRSGRPMNSSRRAE